MKGNYLHNPIILVDFINIFSNIKVIAIPINIWQRIMLCNLDLFL